MSQGNVVLCDTNNALETIKELKLEWALNIINALGIEEEISLNDIEDVMKTLGYHGIEIVDNISDGSAKIYKKELTKDSAGNEYFMPETEKNLIAEWKMPKFVKVIDGKEVYYELHLNEWSIFNIRL